MGGLLLDKHTRCFFVAVGLAVLAAGIVSQQGLTASREQLRQQDELQRRNEQLAADRHRLRLELASAQAEARAYKQLLDAERSSAAGSAH